MLLDKAERIIAHYHELENEMSRPEVVADPSRMETLGREYTRLGKGIPLLRAYIKLLQELEQARSLLASETDQEMRQMAEDEVAQHEARLPELEDKVKLFLVPRDPRDERNAIVEIRAGTGGTEAGIFGADLYRMYTRYAELQGWSTEVLESSYGDLGAIKEVSFLVRGDGAYGALKHESGVHRVQRVPQTEAQGRVHTSAATVVVLPEADEVEVDVDPKDLRTDVYRASGAGGQHVNKTESAVRIVHIPTGITVTCQDEKSQHKNRAKAMKVLMSRLYDQKLSEQEDKERQVRRTMVGSGDRSAKIRTYNFPQDRVTDHRINLSLYRLEEIINGNIQELIDALSVADSNERLKQQ
jgi:peptide chain release factor 1